MSVVRTKLGACAAALIATAALVAPSSPVAAVPPEGTMLTLTWDTGSYYSVDPATADTTLLGTSELLSSTGIAWDSTTQTLFGMDYDVSPASLYTLDPDTGAATVVGSMELDDPTGLDIQPGTGTIFITYDDDQTGGSLLATVDKTTAAVSDVAPTLDGDSAVRIGAIAFHPTSGTLYGVGYDGNLYEIDPATGALTLLFGLEISGAAGLTFDCGGTLYHAETDLVTIDPATGDVTNIGEFPFADPEGDDEFVENLTVICDLPAPETTTTTTTTSTTTTTAATRAAAVTPRFTG